MTRITLLRPLSATIASVLVSFGLSACASPPAGTSGMLGYGTPGVSAYMAAQQQPDGLQAELDRCRGMPQTAASTQTQGLAAACSQLYRTMRNQPGNSIQ